MAHVQLLAAWQAQDFEGVKALLAPDIKATIISADDVERTFNFDQITSLFEKRFNTPAHWSFDVLNKTERGADDIVTLRVFRESDNMNNEAHSSINLLTFKKIDGKK